MVVQKQLSTFDYDEILLLGDLERCKLLIDNAPDKEIVDKLEEIRGKGRDDYPVVAMWNSMLIMPLVECNTIARLRRELSRNRDLRIMCGFDEEGAHLGKHKLVPPQKAYTNLLNNLQTIEPMLKNCFNELRQFMYDNLNEFGKEVGEDGKIFSSQANAPSKRENPDGRSETDADFTFKESYYKDTDGTTKVKKTKYFGFRVHILGEVNYELPIEYTVTSASKGEREQFKKHIEMLPEELRNKIKSASADKGYDSKELIQFLKNKGISPVIDICNHWSSDEKTKQYKDTDIVYNYKGEVFFVNDKSELLPLKYKGYDKTRETLRYSLGEKIYSIDINEDSRVFTPIARDSIKWQRIYNKRTALERINGRLDRDFNLEENKVRGLGKATVMIDIMMIGMLSMAKGHILSGRPEKVRCLKTL